MSINIELIAARRAAQICQDNKEPYNNLTMIAALKRVAREFSEGEKEDGDIKGIINEIIC